MPAALIIGASSGIGRSLAIQLAAAGYDLALVARRETMLRALAESLPGRTHVESLDITDGATVERRLPCLIQALGALDLYIHCAGTGHVNPDLAPGPERETTAVNVEGFLTCVLVVSRIFEQHGRGHIVGVSSVAAIRGNPDAPAYGASKAFMSHYLEALHLRYARRRTPIVVTDVQPGFVDTAMAKSPERFWVATPETAARQIIAAVFARKRRVYVTRRWRLYAWLMRGIPTRWLARPG
jgi:short-subunit dehydrogenase